MSQAGASDGLVQETKQYQTQLLKTQKKAVTPGTGVCEAPLGQTHTIQPDGVDSGG